MLAPLLEAGAAPEDVRAFALREGFTTSQLVDNVVYASAPARSQHPLIEVKWLVQFHFDGGRLQDIRVERGLTGP